MTGRPLHNLSAPTRTRIALEQSIARGVSDQRLMEDYGITYQQLRKVIDQMAGEEDKAVSA